MPSPTAAVLALSTSLLAAAAFADEPRLGLAVTWGADVLVGSARGEFRGSVQEGGGLSGHAVVARPDSPFGLRFDGTWLVYGSRTVRIPLSATAGRINDEVRTDNSILQLAVGPELAVGRGPLRPYVHAFVGASYFVTDSELTRPDPFPFAAATSTNYDDWALSYGAGAGLRIPLGHGAVSLDAGARYVRNGRVRYLTEHDLRPDGHFDPRRSEGNLLEFRLGFSLHPPSAGTPR